jgi:hypothetical protein
MAEVDPEMVGGVAVAKKRERGRPKKPAGVGSQVRIEKDLATMARLVSSRRGIAIADYLSGILRPVITRDYRQTVRELDSELKDSDR